MNYKKSISIIFGVIIGMLVSSSLIADTSIFFCEETSAYGAAWGVPIERARQIAEQYCIESGGTNCKELLSCETGYAAIATDNEGTIGAACGASSQSEADQLAIKSCREYSNNPYKCSIKHQWRG